MTTNRDIRPLIIPLIAVILGVVLRFLWPADMEWKYDQEYMYNAARSIAEGETAWPMLGMKSGAGLQNPGMSIWAFSLLGCLSSTPVGMVLWIIGLNVAALLGFFAFALTRSEEEGRSTWIWGVALFAVSPLAIVYSRCIWAQDLLPPLTCIILWAHMFRRTRSGSFIWGLIGAILGQIHMSGFFLAFALVLLTFFHDRSLNRKTAWLWWFIGSTVGAAPMLPWVLYVLTAGDSAGSIQPKNLLRIRFLLYFPADALGINIRATMKDEVLSLFAYPRIAGVPTYIVGAAHLFLLGVGIWLLKRLPGSIRNIFCQVREKRYFNEAHGLRLYLTTMGVGLGLLPWMLSFTFHEHYLIVAYPFVYIWLIKVLGKRKRLMVAVLAAQLIITTTFIFYIHINGGATNGEYGATYRSQMTTSHDE